MKMYSRFLTAILAVLLLTASGSATEISGEISGVLPADEYVVVGDLTIVEGETLTIEPGAVFLFDGNYAFWIGQNRTLICQGTETDSIKFMPNWDNGISQWLGINIVYSGTDDALEFCLITGSHVSGIYCHNTSSPTITNCTITGNSAFHGGGIVCEGFSSPTISNCIISENIATFAGGGIYCSVNSNPIITNCTISGNSAVGGGGGIACIEDSSPTISNCIFSGNSTDGSGGGIDCGDSTTIEYCTISGNSADDSGGGICCRDSTTIEYCTINGNSALYSYGGGGIYCSDSTTIIYCIISENLAGFHGGGICCYESSSTISNCSISGNSAHQGGGIYFELSNPEINGCNISGNLANWGGGIYCYNNSSPAITDCTISGNSNEWFGGGIYCSDSNPTISNCAVTDNIGEGIYVDDGSPNITYSDFHNNSDGDFGGGGIDPNLGVIVTTNANGDSCDAWMNISLDPMYVDPDNGDYHLQESSPCIDAGDPDSPLDPDGTIADIGAFYFNQLSVPDFPDTELPDSYAISAAYPNPFNPTTTISISLPQPVRLNVSVFNVTGQQVAELADASFREGAHQFTFDASNLAGGVYFVRASSKGWSEVRKIVLVR